MFMKFSSNIAYTLTFQSTGSHRACGLQQHLAGHKIQRKEKAVVICVYTNVKKSWHVILSRSDVELG